MGKRGDTSSDFPKNTFNFEDDAKVNFYDYSKPALAYKKMMLKQWNGEDYPAFISWARKKYSFNIS